MHLATDLWAVRGRAEMRRKSPAPRLQMKEASSTYCRWRRVVDQRYARAFLGQGYFLKRAPFRNQGSRAVQQCQLAWCSLSWIHTA